MATGPQEGFRGIESGTERKKEGKIKIGSKNESNKEAKWVSSCFCVC